MKSALKIYGVLPREGCETVYFTYIYLIISKLQGV